MAFVCSRNM